MCVCGERGVGPGAELLYVYTMPLGCGLIKVGLSPYVHVEEGAHGNLHK